MEKRSKFKFMETHNLFMDNYTIKQSNNQGSSASEQANKALDRLKLGFFCFHFYLGVCLGFNPNNKSVIVP